MSTPQVDIVVPVHGALDAADDCILSVLAYSPTLSRLLVVDDASEASVASELDRLALSDARVEILRQSQNQGFVRSVNRGLAESMAPYVCVLNSDTVVTPGWLEAMIRCAESDPRIAVVNPLSNAAVNLTVQMAPGADVFTMAQAVEAVSARTYPDVVTAVGFCFLITRATLDRFGGFDEIFGQGYCEESDYCMRVTAAGYRTVVADDAFVYHRGGASFGRSRERYERNRRIFDERWASRYLAEYDAFLQRDPLKYLRAALEAGLVEAPTTPPSPVAARAVAASDPTLWAMVEDAWRKRGLVGLAAKIPVAPRRLMEAVDRRRERYRNANVTPPPEVPPPPAFVDPERRRLLLATPSYTARLPRGQGLRVGVLMWTFDVCGGVLAIVDLVNRMVLGGHSVVMATLDHRHLDAAFPLYARPLVFDSVPALADGLPELDVIVATHWPTAARWLPAIRERHPRVPIAYFVQDYESWFLPEDDAAGRREIEGSYGLADRLIVTTAWLRDKLAAHGHDSTIVPVGIDPRVFNCRDGGVVRHRASTQAPRVLVQARPSARWRGFRESLVVLERLARSQDIDVVFYGCRDEELGEVPFRYENAGVIAARGDVAALYASCDVLFDPSRFQAFGLPGLEAMACGCPAVLPNRGGITEYAVHGHNCLLVDPGDIDGCVDAIRQLLHHEELRTRLIAAGQQTARAFTADAMARGHLDVYRQLVRSSRTATPR